MPVIVEERVNVKVGYRELVTTALKIVNCYNLEYEPASRYFSTSFLSRANLGQFSLFKTTYFREIERIKRRKTE